MSHEEFIREYSKLIANASRAVPQGSLEETWWATWLPSRNRFLSKFGKDLESVYLGRPVVRDRKVYRGFFAAIRFSFYFLGKVFYCRWKLRNRLKLCKSQFSNKPIYMIKTFAYPSDFKNGEFRDGFFQRLPEHLRKDRCLNVLTIYDPIGSFRTLVRLNQQVPDLLPFMIFMRAFDFISIWLQIFRGLFLSFNEKLSFQGNDVAGLIRYHYIRDLFSADTYFTLCFSRAFKRIAQQFSITHFLFSNENNPWERMCVLAFRRSSPQTKLIGYQHTVVSQSSVNMFPSDGEVAFAPYPDAVFTVGKENASTLTSLGAYGQKVAVIPSCALRFEYLEKLGMRSEGLQKILLIALEGVPQAVEMLEYVLRQQEKLVSGGWKIIVRLHPALLLRPDDLLKLNGSEAIKNKSIIVSNGMSLKQDLDRSGVVMYWGSSVALEAMKLGLPIVHFDRGDLLSYDPVFTCSSLKWTVDKNTDLLGTLEEIGALSMDQLTEQRKLAQAFLEGYFSPVTPERLNLFADF